MAKKPRKVLKPLADRPSKQAVIAVFGQTRYVLSWIARADRLGITPEELCDRFKTDPNRVNSSKDSRPEMSSSTTNTIGDEGSIRRELRSPLEGCEDFILLWFSYC